MQTERHQSISGTYKDHDYLLNLTIGEAHENGRAITDWVIHTSLVVNGETITKATPSFEGNEKDHLGSVKRYIDYLEAQKAQQHDKG